MKVFYKNDIGSRDTILIEPKVMIEGGMYKIAPLTAWYLGKRIEMPEFQVNIGHSAWFDPRPENHHGPRYVIEVGPKHPGAVRLCAIEGEYLVVTRYSEPFHKRMRFWRSK